MGFVLGIHCPACGYRAHGTVGDGRHVLGICRACRNVVNPAVIPFRLDPPPCPECGTPVPVREGSPESCPRCDSALRYERGMHFSLRVSDRYPALGALVHVWHGHPTETARWKVPNVWLMRGEVVLLDVPEDLAQWRYEGPVFEAEVVGIEKSAQDEVTRLFLSFRQVVEPHQPRGPAGREGEGRNRESLSLRRAAASLRRMTMGGDSITRAPSDPTGGSSGEGVRNCEWPLVDS
jgi:hypothetical protein